MIQEVDAWVGQLVNQLEAAGIDDNTLVIYTSDHGEMLGAHAMKNKWNFLEESVRIPLILSFPGVIPSGLTVKV